VVIRAAAVALLALVASVAAAASRPSFTTQAGNLIAAELPLTILGDAKVSKQLGSGLTTTFVLQIRQRQQAPLIVARLEVRYDVWDEVWLVRRVEAGKAPERQRLASRAALETWWRTPVRLFAAATSPVKFDLDLLVLPFSTDEEKETRQWVSKAGGVGTSARTSGLVDALIGTTIEARPIMSWQWSVEHSLR
jgi:hypothetical protein